MIIYGTKKQNKTNQITNNKKETQIGTLGERRAFLENKNIIIITIISSNHMNNNEERRGKVRIMLFVVMGDR